MCGAAFTPAPPDARRKYCSGKCGSYATKYTHLLSGLNTAEHPEFMKMIAALKNFRRKLYTHETTREDVNT